LSESAVDEPRAREGGIGMFRNAHPGTVDVTIEATPCSAMVIASRFIALYMALNT
jgi:hypothetical protein